MATEAERKIHDTLNAPDEATAKAAPTPGVPPTPDPRWGVENCCVREFWAVIERDASLVRGIFTEPPGEITVALRCCPGLGLFEPFEDNKGVWIQTFDSAGKPTDRSFHLIVLTH